jgi:hypothetical protein
MNWKNVLAVSCMASLVVVGAWADTDPAAAMSIQQMLDAAEPGDIVSVPAGTYHGTLVLKDGVALVGEGADTTILDGDGADCVILAGGDSVILGFTIRNGRVGIQSIRRFVGVFECRVADCAESAIRIENGCAVIANNEILGNRVSMGIECLGSNPHIAGNLIARHRIGIVVLNEFVPTVFDNVFVDNEIAIFVGDKARVILKRNTFDRNRTNILGQPLDESDVIQSAASSAPVTLKKAEVEEYRKLMDLVFAEKLPEHPVVIYDLMREKELGSFGMTVLYPCATFAVSASTKDTRVVNYAAYDAISTRDLRAEYVEASLPTVVVQNEDLTEKWPERYVLDALYCHPGSYFSSDTGQRLFRRHTNIPRIEIVVPEGYLPTSINYPAVLDWRDDRLTVKIDNMGDTFVEMVMDPIVQSAP